MDNQYRLNSILHYSGLHFIIECTRGDEIRLKGIGPDSRYNFSLSKYTFENYMKLPEASFWKVKILSY